MNEKLSRMVWRCEIHPTSRKLALLCLAFHSSDEGVCQGAVSTIARMCGVGDRVARENLSALERDGWLKKVPTFRPDGASWLNEYHLSITKISNANPTSEGRQQ